MRLGILALLLSLGLVVPGAPAQAREMPTAAEVVHDAIADADRLVDWARGVGDPSMTASLKRDRASLRELRASLRSDTSAAERRHVRYVARSTIACSWDKARYALRGPERLRALMAESAAAAQAALDAHDPDAPEAQEIEALLAEALRHRERAVALIAVIAPATAPVRCDRPQASLVAAALRYQAAEDASFQDHETVLEAAALMIT